MKKTTFAYYTVAAVPHPPTPARLPVVRASNRHPCPEEGAGGQVDSRYRGAAANHYVSASRTREFIIIIIIMTCVCVCVCVPPPVRQRKTGAKKIATRTAAGSPFAARFSLRPARPYPSRNYIIPARVAAGSDENGTRAAHRYPVIARSSRARILATTINNNNIMTDRATRSRNN